MFGHSIGGVIALVAAQREPELVRSVLAYEAPSPGRRGGPRPRPAPAQDPADEAEAFMRRAIGDRFWSRLPARTRDGPPLRRSCAAGRPGVAAGRGALRPGARSRCPCCAAAGADTTWWHLRASRELAEALPDGELTVVAGCEHGVHLSHPAAAAHLVRAAEPSNRAAVASAGHVPDP